MEEIVLIRFVDADVRAETLFSVRAGEGLVGLCLVLPEGEVEVVMTPADARRLLEAVQVAVAVAEASR